MNKRPVGGVAVCFWFYGGDVSVIQYSLTVVRHHTILREYDWSDLVYTIVVTYRQKSRLNFS